MSLEPKLKEAVDRLRIADVTLKSINATLTDDFDPEILEESIPLSIQTITPICKSVTHYHGGEEGLYQRRSVFEMFAALRLLRPNIGGYADLSPEELNKLLCAKVECHFLVSYDETSSAGDFLDDDALKIFAKHNVPFNMWPYWREVVQSACSRMGLPRVILPTHRLRRSATT